MIRLYAKAIFIPLVLLALISPLPGQGTGQPVAICSLGQFTPWIGDRRIDPELKRRLNAQDIQVGSLEYTQVTRQTLHTFHIVIVQWVPPPGNTSAVKIFRRAMPVLVDYVRDGGGMLVTCEARYDAEKTVNELLHHFGCRVLSESIIDRANAFQQARYLQFWFATTRNIHRPHPVTDGIERFVYPLSHSLSEGRGTLPLAFDKPGEWQILIRAEKTATTSGGSYTNSPPILAARDFGKGRIAVMPMHTTYFVNAGYHRIWEHITMGDDKGKGTGARLLLNLFRWLSEPAVKAGLGGFHEPEKQAKASPKLPEGVAATDPYTRIALFGRKPVKRIIRKKTPPKHDFTGIIGIYTDLSRPLPNKYGYGWGNVSNYSSIARQYGFDFLVFTDKLEFMTREKWDKLVEACRKNSDEQFIAIPGIEYEDGWGNRRIAFNLPRFPDAKWLSKDGKRVLNHPGFYFGLDWTPVYLLAPTMNFSPPWFAKFYSGMEVVAYEGGTREIARAFKWYRQTQANDYNLIPIVTHRIHSPKELERMAYRLSSGTHLYLSHVRADKVGDIPSAFRYFWYAPRRAYVSSGPKITDWHIENGRGATRDEPWRLYIKVTGDVPLKELTLWDRNTVFRRWLFTTPTKTFQQEINGYHDRQRFFLLEARDEDGGHAISSALYTSDTRHSTYMCTDLQNTLNSMHDVDPASGRFTYFGVMGGYVTGWDSGSIGILVPEWELMPPGLDYVVKGFGFGATHRVIGARSVQPESAVARREMVFACGDVNILDNLYETTLLPGSFKTPCTLAQSRARYISFTPEPYGLNIMLIEQDVQFLRELTFTDTDEPQLSTLHIRLPANSFARYSLVTPDGRKKTAGRPEKLGGTVRPGGYIAFYPDFYGAVAVFPLDAPVDYAVFGGVKKGGRAEFGFSLTGQTVKVGQRFRSRYLLVRGRFGDETDSGFDKLRSAFMLKSNPAYSVHIQRGRIKSTLYLCTLQAEDYAVAGEIERTDIPVPLPVVIEGLNERWDAGLVDLSGTAPRMRRVGVFESKGWLELDPRRASVRFAAGNLLVCDDTSVSLSLIKEDSKWFVEAHNSDAESKEVTVQIPKWVKVVPAQKLSIALKPGSGVRVQLQVDAASAKGK